MNETLQMDGRKSIKPTEGVLFEVLPLIIDRNLFQNKRKDKQQELTRKRILKAFDWVDKNPERYGKPFYTLMPEKTWDEATCGWLIKHANKLGDHLADWIEQALEWAQRISNGETWQDVCNNPDTANWYRLIWSINNSLGRVGGSRKDGHFISGSNPASNIICARLDSGVKFKYTVPLVVVYK